MPAYPHEVEQARGEGVAIRFLTAPARFVGRTWLEGVACVRMQLGEPDESGRARPVPVAGSEHVVPCETAIKAIGQEPRSELADWIEGSSSTSTAAPGSIPQTGRTSEPWIYAAGDATNGGATVVEAVREGKLAARTIDADLRSDPVKEIRWHARAGQGAKTAAQLLALALLREGKSVQAFPEYGPERRGAPDARLHALRRQADPPPRLDRETRTRSSSSSRRWPSSPSRPRARCSWSTRSGTSRERFRSPPRRISANVNLVMLGALAAALGEPSTRAAGRRSRRGDRCEERSRGDLRAALEAGAARRWRSSDARPERLDRAPARRRRRCRRRPSSR